MSRPLLADQLGGEPLAITLAGAPVPAEQVGPVVIRHGRETPSQPPDPATCSLTLLSAGLPRLPRIGDPLLLELGPGAVDYAGLTGPALDAARVRFTGHVTDVTARPATPGTPATVAVIAASPRARLGRTVIGDVPWPVELDGARAQRILDLAAPEAGAPVGLIDPGTVTVTARDIDRQPALDLLNTLAMDSGATLVERRDSTLDWHDAQHRLNGTADLELTARQVLSSVQATQQLAGLVNELRVTYGPEVEEGERPTLVFTDPASRADYGPLSASLGTQLQELADAQAFAELTVGRRSRPVWELRELTVDLVRTIPAATAAQLLGIEHAALIAVTGFPTSGPFRAARLWVEGWTETITRTSWTVVLAVSDYGRTGPAARWIDVPSTVTWAALPADLTWLSAAGWDPGAEDLGRWVDRPADQRWTTTDPALAWSEA
jgi:hypothetical protein